MYGISHIRSVSVGLDSQIWYLFIYITGYLNVRKMSETMDFRTFVGPHKNCYLGNAIQLQNLHKSQSLQQHSTTEWFYDV